MRVSIVMPSASPTGGAEEAFLQLLRSMAGRTISWQVLFLEQGPLISVASKLAADVQFIPCGRTRELVKWWRAAGHIATSATSFKSQLLLGWMTKGHVYAGLASWRSGIECDWFQMGLPESGVLDRASSLLPKRRIYACSEFVATLQRTANPGVSVIPIPLGVDLRRFDLAHLPTPSQCRVKLGLPNNRPIVGIVGRLQRWKGMHVLIQAMGTIIEKHQGAMCVIVGGSFPAEPLYQQELHALVERLALRDHVIFAGAQSNVPEWMQAMDIFVHLSEREPYGIVVVEAMALGKPVIASVPGGPQEIFAHGAVGDLVASGDVQSLSDSIVRLLEQKVCCVTQNVTIAHSLSSENYAKNLIRAITQ